MKGITAKSKHLAYLLRHSFVPDNSGWIDVATLVREYGYSTDELEEIVTTDVKNRYEFSEDKIKIRARQGHSNHVEIGFAEMIPPDVLYHGTSTSKFELILKDGIRPMSRQYVHLSSTIEVATKVGQRHGKPIVLIVDAAAMYRDGIKFFLSSNGVWLTAHVAPQYLKYKK